MRWKLNKLLAFSWQSTFSFCLHSFVLNWRPTTNKKKKRVFVEEEDKKQPQKKGALIRNTTTHAYFAPACKLKKRANEKLKFTAFKNGLLLSKTQRSCASDYVCFAWRNGKKKVLGLPRPQASFFFDCLLACFICFSLFVHICVCCRMKENKNSKLSATC